MGRSLLPRLDHYFRSIRGRLSASHYSIFALRKYRSLETLIILLFTLSSYSLSNFILFNINNSMSIVCYGGHVLPNCSLVISQMHASVSLLQNKSMACSRFESGWQWVKLDLHSLRRILATAQETNWNSYLKSEKFNATRPTGHCTLLVHSHIPNLSSWHWGFDECRHWIVTFLVCLSKPKSRNTCSQA